MATIPTNNSMSVLRIREFLGLNRNNDGDTKIRVGELSEMRNFKITQDKHLQIRPGTKTMVNLRSAWDEWKKTHSTSVTSPVLSGSWEGMVGATHHVVAAFGGVIWDITRGATWSAKAVGEISQDDTHFFGFSNKLYVLNGHEYKSWDGAASSTFQNVEGYVPVVYTAMKPDGSGTELQPVNRLTGKRRVKFSPDGTATVFHLPEQNIDEVVSVSGTSVTYTVQKPDGTVTFASAVTKGVNSIEITYRKGNGARSEVLGMHYSEMYNGSTDTRVFLYGDGSNKTIYSGLDYNGIPSAEYFPDLYEASVGEANTPITAMVRHYSRMLIFKTNSAWSMQYSTMTLDNGIATAAFNVLPMNRQFGNDAMGQARLLENNPLTMDVGGIYRWQATSSTGVINASETNAQRISQRVQEEFDNFDVSQIRTFNSKQDHEFWFIYQGRAVILNYNVNAWYVYTNMPFNSMLEVENNVYGMCTDGRIVVFSREYRNDDGEEIDAYAATGDMDFDVDWKTKYSPLLYVAMKPETNARINVTAESNRRNDYPSKLVSYAIASLFTHTDFEQFSFRTSRKPQTARVKMKLKKATYYKLVFWSKSTTATATILETDIQYRVTGNVK